MHFPILHKRLFCESTEQIIWGVNNTRKDAKNWVFNYNVLKGMTENKKTNAKHVGYTNDKVI